jgi:hypothetical protein
VHYGGYQIVARFSLSFLALDFAFFKIAQKFCLAQSDPKITAKSAQGKSRQTTSKPFVFPCAICQTD